MGFKPKSSRFCTPESSGCLTCFHSRTALRRVDSFYFARGSLFKKEENIFSLACDLRGLELGVPNHILDRTVRLHGNGSAIPVHTHSLNYTLPIKREGANNIWHTLLVVFSMTLSLDVLQMSQLPVDTIPYFTNHDIENTQVLILDDKEDGPYLICRKTNHPNGDWKTQACEDSSLLRAFRRHVLDHFRLDSDIQIPYITIRSIDFATIPFAEQLSIAQRTDVLISVHGAAIIEILPPDLHHRGFRNVAALLAHHNLHESDVFIEKERRMEVVDVAIKSVYNRGP
ncbi:hypothetical protein BDW71DRAFT_197586 [Aspergillus fruticulosus]